MKRHAHIPHKQLAAFCRRWDVVRFSIFGSFIREDYNSDSDVDVLVEFSITSKHSLLDLVRMQHELENLFNRNVDLLTKQGVQSSRNVRRRDEILSTAEVIYAA